MRYDSWWVEVLRSKLLLGLRLFYADIYVEGQEKVPQQGPVVLASNHNNAVLDALILGFFSGGRRPGFLTRADVFKSPLLRKFFSQLRMIPVYRTRDGVDIRTANDRTFSQVGDWLAQGQSVIIFPEGDKGKYFHLLPAKKGIARMSLPALSRLSTDLFIVPAGITYAQLHAVRTPVVIRYGDPIRVQDYAALYASDPDQAYKQLTADVAATIKQLMWHVPAEEVPLLQWWTDQQRNGSYHDRVVRAYQWWEQAAPDNRMYWRQQVAHWQEQGVNPLSIQRSVSFPALFFIVVVAPVIPLALLWQVLPFFLPSWLAHRLSGHPHFHTSIRFGLLWLAFPFFSLVQALLLALLLPGWGIVAGVLAAIGLPVVLWQWYRAVRHTHLALAWRMLSDSLKDAIKAAIATLS